MRFTPWLGEYATGEEGMVDQKVQEDVPDMHCIQNAAGLDTQIQKGGVCMQRIEFRQCFVSGGKAAAHDDTYIHSCSVSVTAVSAAASLAFGILVKHQGVLLTSSLRFTVDIMRRLLCIRRVEMTK